MPRQTLPRHTRRRCCLRPEPEARGPLGPHAPAPRRKPPPDTAILFQEDTPADHTQAPARAKACRLGHILYSLLHSLNQQHPRRSFARRRREFLSSRRVVFLTPFATRPASDPSATGRRRPAGVEVPLVEVPLVEVPLVEVPLVEVNGIEPMTSCLQSRRSPN